MAEVNAFSIDGTKYQLTATDQTYVGETGLAQLGLDYGSSPGDCEDALADAGGGRLIISGRDVTDDGWATDSIAGGGRCLLDMLCTPRPDDGGHMCSLMAHGVTNVYGTYQRAHGEDGAWDTGWATLVYGKGDTCVTTGLTYLVGQTNTSSSSTVQLGLTLPAPIAPGVSSASVTSVGGTAYIRYLDGSSQSITKASAFDASIAGPGELRLDVSGADYGDANAMCMARLPTGFTIEFS